MLYLSEGGKTFSMRDFLFAKFQIVVWPKGYFLIVGGQQGNRPSRALTSSIINISF